MTAAADLEALMRRTDDETRPMAERLQACDRLVEYFADAGNLAAEAFALDRRALLVWTSSPTPAGRTVSADLRRAIALASSTPDQRLEAICRADLATYLVASRAGTEGSGAAVDEAVLAEAIDLYRAAIPMFMHLGELEAALNANRNLDQALTQSANLHR